MPKLPEAEGISRARLQRRMNTVLSRLDQQERRRVWPWNLGGQALAVTIFYR